MGEDDEQYSPAELRFWGGVIVVMILGFFAIIAGTVGNGASERAARQREAAAPLAGAATQAQQQQPSQPADGVQSTRRPMGFEACLATIRRTAQELGVAPENVVETNGIRVVRFPTTDGSVLMTCDGEALIITLSPSR